MHTRDVTDLLSALKRHALPGQIAGMIERPARENQTAPWPDWVHPDLRAALAAAGAESAWIHQAQAAQCVHEGRHVVLASGWESARQARALGLRVGLSIVLFLCLLLAWKLGYIQPTGLPAAVR